MSSRMMKAKETQAVVSHSFLLEACLGFNEIVTQVFLNTSTDDVVSFIGWHW